MWEGPLLVSFLGVPCSAHSPDTLAEKLADHKLNVAEVTQSETGQKQKLQTVLEAVQGLLQPHGWALRWTVDCEWPWGWPWGLPLRQAPSSQFRPGPKGCD